MQGFHCLLDRHTGVEPVDLQEVQIVGAQTLQAGVDGAENRLAREAALIHVVFARLHLGGVADVDHAGLFANGAEAFREDDEFVAWDVD